MADVNSERSLNEVISRVRLLSNRHPGIEAVGVSLPGLVDPSTGIAVYVPYFKWREVPVAQTISSAVKKSTE